MTVVSRGAPLLIRLAAAAAAAAAAFPAVLHFAKDMSLHIFLFCTRETTHVASSIHGSHILHIEA